MAAKMGAILESLDPYFMRLYILSCTKFPRACKYL